MRTTLSLQVNAVYEQNKTEPHVKCSRVALAAAVAYGDTAAAAAAAARCANTQISQQHIK